MRSPSPWRYDDGYSLPVVVDGKGHVIAEVRGKANIQEMTDNGKLLAAADKLLEASAALLEDMEKLNIQTKTTARMQTLLLEVTGDPRYRRA